MMPKSLNELFNERASWSIDQETGVVSLRLSRELSPDEAGDEPEDKIARKEKNKINIIILKFNQNLLFNNVSFTNPRISDELVAVFNTWLKSDENEMPPEAFLIRLRELQIPPNNTSVRRPPESSGTVGRGAGGKPSEGDAMATAMAASISGAIRESITRIANDLFPEEQISRLLNSRIESKPMAPPEPPSATAFHQGSRRGTAEGTEPSTGLG